jgi:predicted nucleotidyltransferase
MDIEQILKLYSALGRPLTLMEAARISGLSPRSARDEVQELTARGKLKAEDGFYSAASDSLSATQRKKQDLLLDIKWRKLARLAKWLRFAPFVELVMVNGSLAIGNVNPNSDFDVLVGVRAGRIFTARYFLNFIFGIAGGRRLDDEKDSSPDRFCFNHFITQATFARGAPDTYERLLYRDLVPLWGDLKKIREFFRVNAWCGANEFAAQNLRFLPGGRNLVGQLMELFLGGHFGNFIENRLLAPIAKRRLAAYLSSKPKEGRTVVSDAELEFHFNLRYKERFSSR